MEIGAGEGKVVQRKPPLALRRMRLSCQPLAGSLRSQGGSVRRLANEQGILTRSWLRTRPRPPLFEAEGSPTGTLSISPQSNGDTALDVLSMISVPLGACNSCL